LIGYIIYDFVVLKMEIEKKIKELTAALEVVLPKIALIKILKINLPDPDQDRRIDQIVPNQINDCNNSLGILGICGRYYVEQRSKAPTIEFGRADNTLVTPVDIPDQGRRGFDIRDIALIRELNEFEYRTIQCTEDNWKLEYKGGKCQDVKDELEAEIEDLTQALNPTVHLKEHPMKILLFSFGIVLILLFILSKTVVWR